MRGNEGNNITCLQGIRVILGNQLMLSENFRKKIKAELEELKEKLNIGPNAKGYEADTHIIFSVPPTYKDTKYSLGLLSASASLMQDQRSRVNANNINNVQFPAKSFVAEESRKRSRNDDVSSVVKENNTKEPNGKRLCIKQQENFEKSEIQSRAR